MNGLSASRFAADDPRNRHDAISAATRRGPPSSSSGNFTIESLISTAVNRRGDGPPPLSPSTDGLSSSLSICAAGVMSAGGGTTSTSPDRLTTMITAGGESRDDLRARMTAQGELSAALPSGAGTYSGELPHASHTDGLMH